jgi:hypothetical protein
MSRSSRIFLKENRGWPFDHPRYLQPGETGYLVTVTATRVVTPLIVTLTFLVPAAAFTLTVAEFEVNFLVTAGEPATTIFAVLPEPLAIWTVTTPLPPVTVGQGRVLVQLMVVVAVAGKLPGLE